MATPSFGERYSALGLLRHGLTGRAWPRLWEHRDLAPTYDAVVIGGGIHGLATAYYLAHRHEVGRVAVVERSYLGSGGSGRNTAILRSNYLTPEGSRFYHHSLQLYRRLTTELNFNVLFEQRGHLTLAHDDGAVRTLRWRAEVNKAQGIDSEVIGRRELAQLAPVLDLSERPRYPVLGALWHPPGGIVRHDAVVWAYARAAAGLGVELHQGTEVTGIDVSGGRVTGVRTTRRRVATPVVVNCTAGWSSTVAAMAGLELPIVTKPLQAAVTEPVRPFLDPVVVSANLHVYVNQTTRGELVLGGSVDPFASYSTRGSLEFLEQVAGHVLELMPTLSHLRILRQWAGICDMTPDFAPIISRTPIEGFVLDVGWGTYGFKAGPAAGEATAALAAGEEVPELVRPFSLQRFERGELVAERGAAAVGH